jgi:hypothetical protein
VNTIQFIVSGHAHSYLMGDQCVSGIIRFTEQIHDNGLKGAEVLDSLGGADRWDRKGKEAVSE